MFFLAALTQDRKDLDFDQTMICDVCGAYGHLQVFMTCMVFSFFFIPLFRYDRHYYVESSCCHSLYELDPAIGKALRKGQISRISKEDLHLIRGESNTGSYKKCAYCAYETYEDFDYCPKCGNHF